MFFAQIQSKLVHQGGLVIASMDFSAADVVRVDLWVTIHKLHTSWHFVDQAIVFGHIHRIEMQHQTRRVRSGSRSNLAACPGCLCRVDGAVPGFKASTDIYGRPVQSWENWQQGIAVVYYEEGDGPFHVELVPIHDGTCIFHGKTYTAST